MNGKLEEKKLAFENNEVNRTLYIVVTSHYSLVTENFFLWFGIYF